MIISKLPIVLPARGPVSCDDVRVPEESMPLIAPVGAPFILGLNKPATTGPFSPRLPMWMWAPVTPSHVFKMQFIVYYLLMSYM